MRRISLVLSIFLFASTAFPQDEEISLLSLSRLSVSVGISYAFVPWDKFNDSYQFAADVIGYDPFYQSPSGHFEKIRGDVVYNVRVNYVLHENLKVLLYGGTSGTSAAMRLGENPFSMEERHEFDWGMTLFGVGIEHELWITGPISLVSSAVIGSASAELHAEYRTTYAPGANVIVGSMSDAAPFVLSAVALKISVVQGFSIRLDASHRSVRFNELRGDASLRVLLGEAAIAPSYDFDAYYAEGDRFVGMGARGGVGADNANSIISLLWSRASVIPYYYSLRPGVLDLSGFSVSFSSTVEF